MMATVAQKQTGSKFRDKDQQCVCGVSASLSVRPHDELDTVETHMTGDVCLKTEGGIHKSLCRLTWAELSVCLLCVLCVNHITALQP